MKWILVLIGLTFISCNTEGVHLENPLLDSFKNRGINVVVQYSINPLSFYDTLFLDENGQVIKHVAPLTIERLKFNSDGFLERVLTQSDTKNNYVIINELKSSDTLVQKWFELSHNNWIYSQEDIVKPEIDRKTFILKNGKVIEQYDNFEKVIYEYGKDGKLILKRIESESRIFEEKYFYHNDTISIVERWLNKNITERMFLSNGLPDSIHYHFNDKVATEVFQINYKN